MMNEPIIIKMRTISRIQFFIKYPLFQDDSQAEVYNQEIVKTLKANGAKRSVKPDFSEVSLSWGNSFGSHEYMTQVRGAWIDKRYGFYAETGVDWRPVPFKVQIRENDTLIYQYQSIMDPEQGNLCVQNHRYQIHVLQLYLLAYQAG